MDSPRHTRDSRWQSAAACSGTDPRLFTDPRADTDDTDRAIAICRDCPVRRPCLTEALNHPADADVGIWGATTPEDRRTLRRWQRVASPRGPMVASLFPTLDGELTDLTGQAVIISLPTRPGLLLLINGKTTLVLTGSTPSAGTSPASSAPTSPHGSHPWPSTTTAT